jgi:hypothetical protein
MNGQGSAAWILDAFGAQQAALPAARLELKLAVDNPFRGFDFFETAGRVAGAPLASRLGFRPH